MSFFSWQRGSFLGGFFLSMKELYLERVGKSVYSFRIVFKREIVKERRLEFSHTLLMKYSPQIQDLPFLSFEIQLIMPCIRDFMA